ncbi:MAG: ABC transporter substrate-binding protein [Oscillospiraceae bacterium]|jgi:iron complex transport system substrate-binding protein|nr:ABC transporter substrate-binding protein [Oscillospiraceae bacterium]
MKRTLSLIIALALTFALFAGCTAKTETPATPTPSPAAVATPAAENTPAATPTENAEAATERSFTDSVGRTVTLPATITKISPSGALAQMFLIAIAPDLLVSVASEYSDSNAKYVASNLSGLPVVGQFYGSDDLNFETIANIAPDVVIDVGEPKKTIVEDMDSITEKLAIPSVHVTADLRGTADAFRTLGKLLDREEKGEELAAYCENALKLVDDVVAQVGDNKARAVWALGDNGTNVMAKTSFHAEAFDLVADNVAIADEVSSKGSGNETDLEQIALWNPDVIIFSPNSAYSVAGTDPVWSELTAIKDGAYYEVPQGPYNWMGSPPSINRYIGMLWLTKILYPQYADYDLQALATEYYNLFYGYTLSADEYAALTANSVK